VRASGERKQEIRDFQNSYNVLYSSSIVYLVVVKENFTLFRKYI